jgi:hypothetical protein
VTPADWATAASLATALGTLILAVATFSAVRSGLGGTAAGPRSASSEDHPVWTLTVARHWKIDRPDPRQGDRPVTP